MTSKRSLSSLLQQTDLNDHDEVLKAANNALKTSKSDPTAQHLRLIALLKLDRYDDALRALDEGPSSLAETARFEQSYALYRTGQLQQAEKVLASKKRTRSRMILEAQIAYRLENFRKVEELYADLGASASVSVAETGDLKINASAVKAQLLWAGGPDPTQQKQPDRSDFEQFDTAFNAACAYIAKGQIKQAEFLLGRAKALCEASDDLSEIDKKAEVLPIEVQQLYILSRLGKLDDGRVLSSKMQFEEIPDLATKHVAQVNAFSVRGQDANPYMAQRLFESSRNLSSRDAPFCFQQKLLSRNATTLALLNSKPKAVAKIAARAHEQSSGAEVAWTGVASAAAAARSQAGKAAIKLLLPLLERRSNDIGLNLLLAQLYYLAGNTQTATTLLESLTERLEQSSEAAEADLRHAPGLIVTMVSLYVRQNRLASAREQLAKAARYWRGSKSDQHAPSSLMHHAAAALLEESLPQETVLAHDILVSLQERDVASSLVHAGLLASSTKQDEVLSDIAGLQTVEQLTLGVDVHALESAGTANYRSVHQQTTHSNKRRAPAAATGSRSKKIRPSKMPRNFDPTKKPDPERWLPLRDRSSWRPKGKKKGRAQASASLTQGGVAEERQSANVTDGHIQHKPAGGTKAKKKGKGAR